MIYIYTSENENFLFIEVLMKKLIGLLASGSLCMFAACSSGDDDNSITPPNSWSNNNSAASTVETAESCQAKGLVLNFDQATSQLYCAPAAQSSSEMQSGVSSSAFDPFGNQAGTSSQPGISPTATSSSSVSAAPTVSSSSVAPAPASSQPQPASTPSANPGTGNDVVDDGTFKIGQWDGATGSNQVPTGNKDGGYWYAYTDKGNSGSSTLGWSAEAAPGSTYSDDDLSPIITECGGLCGKFDLIAGANESCPPYVAVAFNYGKTDKVAGDASASGGICVTYKSTLDIEVDMGLGSKDETYGYNLPAVKLPASSTLTTVDLPWSKFEQQWAGEMDITGPAAAKILAAIKFQVKGSAVGEDEGAGTFLITKVGPSGGCK